MRPCGICLSAPGFFFNIASCPLGSFMLSKMVEFPALKIILNVAVSIIFDVQE